MNALALVLVVACAHCACGLTLPTANSGESDTPPAADGMDQNVTLPDGSVRNVRDYLSEFVRDYKRVRASHSPAQLRQATTVGLLAGMVRIEELMKAALSNRTHRFQHDFDASTAEQVLEHLFQLDEQMLRDRKAVELLGGALDVATNVRTYETFREDADALLRDAIVGQLEAKRKRQVSMTRVGKAMGMRMQASGDTSTLGSAEALAMRTELKHRLATTVDAVERHQRDLRYVVKQRVAETVRFLKKSKLSAAQMTVGGDPMEATTDWQDDEATDRPYETFSMGTSILGQVSWANKCGPHCTRSKNPMASLRRRQQHPGAGFALTT